MQVISDDNQNDIEIRNFLICIAMRSDEFTKEVLTTFFKMNFILIKRQMNQLKHISHIYDKNIPNTLTCIYFLYNFQISSRNLFSQHRTLFN